MRRGFDLDGVIFSFGEYFLDYLGIEDKTPPTKWDDERYTKNMHLINQDENFWLGIPPLINPKILEGKVELYCTARAIPAEVTIECLRINGFPNPEKVISVGLGCSKIEALRGKVDVFVDDAVHNFEELNAAGIDCYLLTRSHNVNYKTDKRVDSVEEFLRITADNEL